MGLLTMLVCMFATAVSQSLLTMRANHSVVLLLVYHLFLANSKPFASKATQNSREPFQEIGQFLSRFGSGGPLDGYDAEEITRAVTTISKSQNALKSVDGLTHQFRNAIKER
jgi:hypothetical protein